MCWRKYFRKENPGINYLLHIESNESLKNMVPENSKTNYTNSKTHNSIKTLRNDYNRLRQHRCSYLHPIWSLTCPYRILQESIECFRTQFQHHVPKWHDQPAIAISYIPVVWTKRRNKDYMMHKTSNNNEHNASIAFT